MPITVRSHPWYNTSHHLLEGGFRNIWGDPRDTAFWKSFKWFLSRLTRNTAGEPAPAVTVRAGDLASPSDKVRLTWIGHSNLFIRFPETETTLAQHVLLDPMFGYRASPFSFAGPDRKAELPFSIDSLPGADLVILSHDHYDHLDEGSIRRIEARFSPQFLAPLGVGEILRSWGVKRIAELDWWQYVDRNGYRFHCTPAKHFSGRGMTNRDGTLWSSWYIQTPGRRFSMYFGGDSAYASHFIEIRERLGTPQLALLPVGAYLPRWFMEPVHVDPTEAVMAFTDLGAEYMLPIHWGTFDMADDPLREAATRVEKEMKQKEQIENLVLLSIGETVSMGIDPATGGVFIERTGQTKTSPVVQ